MVCEKQIVASLKRIDHKELKLTNEIEQVRAAFFRKHPKAVNATVMYSEIMPAIWMKFE